jgi:hypothetical protein
MYKHHTAAILDLFLFSMSEGNGSGRIRLSWRCSTFVGWGSQPSICLKSLHSALIEHDIIHYVAVIDEDVRFQLKGSLLHEVVDWL